MKKSVDIEKFEKRLGYTFKDPKYLLEALTHPSFSSTNRSDNQRLESLASNSTLEILLSHNLKITSFAA